MRLLLLSIVVALLLLYTLWAGRFTGVLQVLTVLMLLAAVFVAVLASLRAAARTGW